MRRDKRKNSEKAIGEGMRERKRGISDVRARKKMWMQEKKLVRTRHWHAWVEESGWQELGEGEFGLITPWNARLHLLLPPWALRGGGWRWWGGWQRGAWAYVRIVDLTHQLQTMSTMRGDTEQMDGWIGFSLTFLFSILDFFCQCFLCGGKNRGQERWNEDSIFLKSGFLCLNASFITEKTPWYYRTWWNVSPWKNNCFILLARNCRQSLGHDAEGVNKNAKVGTVVCTYHCLCLLWLALM